MPALFSRDTNTPTMSGANPFQSSNANAVAAGQENQTTEAQQHKQVLEKKAAAADKKYVRENRCRKSSACTAATTNIHTPRFLSLIIRAATLCTSALRTTS